MSDCFAICEQRHPFVAESPAPRVEGRDGGVILEKVGFVVEEGIEDEIGPSLRKPSATVVGLEAILRRDERSLS